MIRGRRRWQWGMLAELLAQNYNLNRDPKKSEAVHPDALNPYLDKKDVQKAQQEAKPEILKVSNREFVLALSSAMCPNSAALKAAKEVGSKQ